jgi:transaldolase
MKNNNEPSRDSYSRVIDQLGIEHKQILSTLVNNFNKYGTDDPVWQVAELVIKFGELVAWHPKKVSDIISPLVERMDQISERLTHDELNDKQLMQLGALYDVKIKAIKNIISASADRQNEQYERFLSGMLYNVDIISYWLRRLTIAAFILFAFNVTILVMISYKK